MSGSTAKKKKKKKKEYVDLLQLVTSTSFISTQSCMQHTAQKMKFFIK